MRFFTFLVLFFFTCEATALERELKESQYKHVEASLGKGKPFFLEIGAQSCRSCQIMSGMLFDITQKHPEYNIYFINVKKEREAAKKLKVMMIPTQIIYDKHGQEVYRHIGVLSGDDLKRLFREHGF